MALADLSAGATPLFLTKNYLSRDAVIAVSKGDALKHRAYDMTRSSRWVALGSTPGDSETYDARLFEGSVQNLRSVDFVALLGMNLRRFKFEYSSNDGAAYSTFGTIDYTGSDYASADLRETIASPVDMNRIKLTATQTRAGTGDEKYVGDIMLASFSFQPIRGTVDYRKSYDDNVKTLRMADGSIDETRIYRSDDSFEMFRCSVGFRGVSQAQRDLLRAVKTALPPFLYYPEPGDVIADVFLCRIAPNSYEESYSTLYKGAGYDINMDIEEIGGA